MRRWSVVSSALILLFLIVLPACGGGGEESTSTPTPVNTATITPVVTITPTVTPTVTTTQAASPSVTTTEPVKIGVIIAYSGALAMSGLLVDQVISVVEDQLKSSGGILGGREVKFIRGDDRGNTAEAVAQAKKQALEEKVCVVTLGGESAAQFTAVADALEPLKVPYVAIATIYGLATGKYQYCASLYTHDPAISRIANFLIDVIKPKTTAFLCYDTEDARSFLGGAEGVSGLRDRLKAQGIDIVYEQFFPLDAMDFSQYLTKIKYLKPDILVTLLNSTGQSVTIAKQITELGGWGDMKYFNATETGANPSVTKIPSSIGTYVAVLWMPGSDDPGMKAFEDAYLATFNKMPDPALTYFYNCFWTAIKAIEMAGTDNPEKVAQALRSGNLEWDSAWGPLRIPADGRGLPTMMVAEIQEGNKLVKVWP